MRDSFTHDWSDTREGGGAADSDVLLRMELPSDPNLLCAVRGAIERLTESLGFTTEDCRGITRAVDEALTNIIRHAYGGKVDQPIAMMFRTLLRAGSAEGQRGIEIQLCDRGPAFEPEKMCGRALDDVKPGGLGLHFIQESMDVVEYKRANGTNCLRLVKYVRDPKRKVNL
jgi:serine/threonine-protein kinase RsbW